MTINEPESDLNPNKDRSCINPKIFCHPVYCATFSGDCSSVFKDNEKKFKIYWLDQTYRKQEHKESQSRKKHTKTPPHKKTPPSFFRVIPIIVLPSLHKLFQTKKTKKIIK